MRFFSELIEKAGAAILGSDADQGTAAQARRRMDKALARYLKSERGLADGEEAQAKRFEALLSELLAIEPDPATRSQALREEEGERFFWEPLARREGAALWGAAMRWSQRVAVEPGSMGLDPKGFALTAMEFELSGEQRQAGRALDAAFRLGLSPSAPLSGKSALGEALECSALDCVKRLREAGFSWESAGLDPEALALGAKRALWPEPLEAQARQQIRVRESFQGPWLDFSESIERARLSGGDAREIDQSAERCARALIQMGAEPNRAPKNPRADGRRFPLEGALLAKAPLLTAALLEAGASPEDERVRGRLRTGLQDAQNPAAPLIQQALAALKAQRDQRYALWKMCLRGELFDAQGRKVEMPVLAAPNFKERLLARSMEIQRQEGAPGVNLPSEPGPR